MIKRLVISGLLVIVLLTPFLTCTVKATTFVPIATTLQFFDNLQASHPTLMKKEIIGYSIYNNPIPIYLIGNPNGGRVLWDARLHTDEDMATEFFKLFSVWLLESNEPKANAYLQTNYFMFIPAISLDHDGYRLNKRSIYSLAETAGTPYEGTTVSVLKGVSLNRNFPAGFGDTGVSDPTHSWDYRGLKGASEPETRAVIYAFEHYNPKIYVNTHMFGGPLMYYGGAINSTLRAEFKSVSDAYYGTITGNTIDGGNPVVLTPYDWDYRGCAGGYAVYQAKSMGINSFLLEIDIRGGYPWEGRTYELGHPALWVCQQYYYPKVLPLIYASLDITAINVPSTPTPPAPTQTPTPTATPNPIPTPPTGTSPTPVPTGTPYFPPFKDVDDQTLLKAGAFGCVVVGVFYYMRKKR